MKTLLKLSLLSSIILILCACSPKLEDEIIGKWKHYKATTTIEFVSDGTVITTFHKGSLSQAVLGKFTFIEKNRLIIEMNGLPEPIIMVVSIQNNVLTSTSPDGEVEKMERVK